MRKLIFLSALLFASLLLNNIVTAQTVLDDTWTCIEFSNKDENITERVIAPPINETVHWAIKIVNPMNQTWNLTFGNDKYDLLPYHTLTFQTFNTPIQIATGNYGVLIYKLEPLYVKK